MNKPTTLALGLVAMLGFAACSSGSKLTVPAATTAASSSANSSATAGGSASATTAAGGAAGISIPDLTGVGGLSAECASYIQALASAFVPQAGGDTNQADLGAAFTKLEAQVPAELKADVQVLADGFTKLQDLYKKYNYDYTKIAADPTAQTLFSDQKFSTASQHLSDWLDTQCKNP